MYCITNVCPAGSAIRAINADGTVTCETDNNTTYSAGSGLTLSGGSFSITAAYRLPQTCTNGQLAKWNGSAWTCSDSAHDHWGGIWSGSGVGLALESDDSWGLLGRSSGVSGVGVVGHASDASGAGVSYGVMGQSDSPMDGIGVYGVASSTAASYSTYGVFGTTSSTAGYGVYGSAVSLNSNYGVYSYGNFGATGSKAAVVKTPSYGWLNLYSVESPQVLFEDVGTAHLADGVTVVTIDPIFAETVNLNAPYQVFVTPLGDCALYVTDKIAASFTVRALGGEKCSLDFDYRIIAKRQGYEDLRLAAAEDPNQVINSDKPQLEILP